MMKRRTHTGQGTVGTQEGQDSSRKLEIVMKCDSMGSEEAVNLSLRKLQIPRVNVGVILSGVGDVSKSDLMMALTGSRLILGFSVGVMPKIGDLAHEQGVEIRLYNVIYHLMEDLKEIAESWVPREEKEKTTGKAKVIALFKSDRKGIILGCEVLEGRLTVGKNFRIISPMGPLYTGKIESLQIEKDAVKEARPGQQAGIKVPDFKKARVGDLVECFEVERPAGRPPWSPSGGIKRLP
jgi:translation initiation factor IF-2